MEPKSKSSRAQLELPVGRIHRMMKNGNYARAISQEAAVCLAAVVEYLATEVLELAMNAAKSNKRLRLTPRYIYLAIKKDDELTELFPGLTINKGGALPNIHKELLPKKTAKKSDE